MNLKTRPLLIVTGIGGLLHLIFSFAIQALSTFAISKLISELQIQTSNAILFTGMNSLANCLCSAGLDTLTGGTYAWLYPRAEPLTPGDGLLGGGAASALARLGSGVLGIFISLLLLPFTLRQFRADNIDGGPMLMMALLQGMIGGIIGLVIGIVLAALFGAVGGVIIALLRERQSGQLAGAGLL